MKNTDNLMEQYQPMMDIRDVDVDGIKPWRWQVLDHGAFDGPKTDWEEHHKHKYFKHVKKFDVCIQAGGCCGMYPRLLANYFDTVYTFEPTPLSFFMLVQNCQLDNVVKIQAALGDKHAMVRVAQRSPINVGENTVAPDETAYVPQLMIDDLDLRACDLICLDVEQYEVFALRGAENTINRFHPVIAVERPGPVVRDFLSAHGYRSDVKSSMDEVFVHAQ